MRHESDVLKQIKDVLEKSQFPHEAQMVFGVYDIVVKISADTDEMLRDIVLERLRKINNIESAITMMVDEAK